MVLVCQFGGDPADPYSVAGYVGRQVDIDVLGVKHIIKEGDLPFDPEGLLSTIPSIVSVVFGYLVGDYIQRKGKTYEMLSNLFVAGLLLVFGGLLWENFMPINKKLWTSSYVVYTTGLAILVLSFLIYIIEFKKINELKPLKTSNAFVGFLALGIAALLGYNFWGYHKHAIDLDSILRILLTSFVLTFVFVLFLRNKFLNFFDAFGKNPLFIFVLAGLLPRLMTLIRIPVETKAGECPKYLNPMTWFAEKICLPSFENLKNGSLLYSMLIIILYWFIAHIMDRKKIYVKV
jgi:predicted acyltransferase